MLRLYFDEDSMHDAVVEAMLRLGHDCQTVATTSRRGYSDETQLAFAAEERRAIYTRNAAHFTALHGAWMEAGRFRAGIVILTDPRASPGRQIRGLVEIDRRYSDLSNGVLYVLNYA